MLKLNFLDSLRRDLHSVFQVHIPELTTSSEGLFVLAFRQNVEDEPHAVVCPAFHIHSMSEQSISSLVEKIPQEISFLLQEIKLTLRSDDHRKISAAKCRFFEPYLLGELYTLYCDLYDLDRVALHHDTYYLKAELWELLEQGKDITVTLRARAL